MRSRFGFQLFLAVLFSFLIMACQSGQKPLIADSEPEAFKQKPMTETEKFNAWSDKMFDGMVDRNPEWQTYVGIKKDHDKLNDYSDAFLKQELEISKQTLEEMKQFDFRLLDHQAQLTYQLTKMKLKDDIENFKWRFHNYPVNQLFGRHSGLPAFMINMHQIADEKDARAYISRIKATKKNFFDLVNGLKKREELGVIPPKFAFAKVSENIRTLLTGAPFTENGKDSSLLEDFKRKLAKIEITKGTENDLIADLNFALKTEFKTAYMDLLIYWERLETKADTRDGIWKLPNGPAFYKKQLKHYTTTDMTADEIHKLGLSEVARIQSEMVAIQKKLKVKGSLQDFFKHVQNKSELFYGETEAGKQQFLTDTNKIISEMKSDLPTVFSILPKADLKVKAVEAFREKSSASAFYNRPAPDGSRPGIYYVNLYDMKEQPKYAMEALAYHEAVPGHHMQIAIAQELEGLPKMRRLGLRYTAYSEGWGLYSELVPKEMGFYKDPYSDFGRLSMELVRAIRLVVDTGIHHKKWTRDQAVQYTLDNSPAVKAEAVRSIERYIVMPGQATAYKIGMLKILELRKKAKEKLGSEFQLSSFHDQVLKNGAVPLNVLEDQIDGWIAKTANRAPASSGTN